VSVNSVSVNSVSVNSVSVNFVSVSNNRSRSHVVSATVASKLHALTYVARQVSMIAKNARALAIRAGETVAGFKPSLVL